MSIGPTDNEIGIGPTHDEIGVEALRERNLARSHETVMRRTTTTPIDATLVSVLRLGDLSETGSKSNESDEGSLS